MRSILVAVDGSDASMSAVRQAAELARAFDSKLTLVHVVAPIFAPPEVSMSVEPWTEAAVRAGEQLLEAAERVANRPCERLNLTGSPAERLADLADSLSVDLVVVGSKGRNAVSRVLIGSVTDRLVHICKRPVLVVR